MGYGQYILDKDGNPQLEPNLIKWAIWLEFSHLSPDKDNRIVESDYIDDVHISTVFLGLDFNLDRVGPPLLWETMIFGGEHDQWMKRYITRADAEAGHRAAVEMVAALHSDIMELRRMMAISEGWGRK